MYRGMVFGKNEYTLRRIYLGPDGSGKLRRVWKGPDGSETGDEYVRSTNVATCIYLYIQYVRTKLLERMALISTYKS